MKRILGLIALLMALFPWVAFAQTPNKFTLTWTDNSSSPNEDGFRIERGPATTGPFTFLATVGANVTTYVDLNLPYATQFCYRVQGTSSTVTNSPFSNVACNTTPAAPDTTAPNVAITTPSSSGAFSTTSTSVTIGGTASDNVGVTSVTWANDRGGSGTASGTTSWSATVALQTGVNNITVMASDAAGNKKTAVIAVTYTLPQLNAPSGLTLSAVSSKTLEWSWLDNSDGESSQILEWRQSSPPRSGQIVVAANVDTYRQKGMQAGKTVCGTVKAAIGSIYSDKSNQSCATTRR